MPDAVQAKTNKQSFVLKKNIVLIVGLTAKMVNKMVQKMVLSWSKLTLDYTKLKLQDQGPPSNGPNPLKMVQNGPKLNSK